MEYEVEAVLRFSSDTYDGTADQMDRIRAALEGLGVSFSHGDVEESGDEED